MKKEEEKLKILQQKEADALKKVEMAKKKTKACCRGDKAKFIEKKERKK